jgi:hypothetical protein
MTNGSTWLPALRRYFGVVVIGNLAWEVAQLPLYTLWKTGSANGIIFSVLHCTGGDLLISGATLIVSLLLFGTTEWPSARFVPVATTTLLSGVSTTALSENFNTARGAWTYSDLMPVLPGTGIGVAPLAQWIVVPILAFVVARPFHPASTLDLPIIGTPICNARRTIWRVLIGDRHERASD